MWCVVPPRAIHYDGTDEETMIIGTAVGPSADPLFDALAAGVGGNAGQALIHQGLCLASSSPVKGDHVEQIGGAWSTEGHTLPARSAANRRSPKA